MSNIPFLSNAEPIINSNNQTLTVLARTEIAAHLPLTSCADIYVICIKSVRYT